jgi:Prokaryotic E2 family E
MLRADDQQFLEGLGLPYQVTSEHGMVCVVIKDWPLPSVYSPTVTDLLLRLAPGFPDVPPDMFWCDPPVKLAATGGFPPAADLFENYLGRTWQRFSRHLAAGQWVASRDSLGSYLALIRRDLTTTAAQFSS